MRRSCALLLLFLLPALSGCAGGARGREPESIVLAQVLGVDRMGELWILTAAGSDGAGEPFLLQAKGESLAAAFDALPGAGDEWVSLTNVTRFLLGDGVEPREVLTFILNDSGMSWRATVWYAPIAAAVMESQEDGGAARLDVLEQGGSGMVTVLDALVELEETGETALPALTVEGGTLAAAGHLHYERSGT